MTSDPEAVGEHTPWWRSPIASVLCRCGHTDVHHNLSTDGLRRTRCDVATGSGALCGCRALDAVALLYAEHRVVRVDLPA